MIIKYPTGLYRDALPVNPEDVGNITFTISNTTPPRSTLIFPKLPSRTADIFPSRTPPSPAEVRRQCGTLVFTISAASRTQAGNNSRQFEIGQVIPFGSNPTSAVEPMLVSKVTETRHDTNILDYDAMGMAAADQELIAAQSFIAHQALSGQLNDLKQKRADAEVMVTSQQKTINETNRTIAAMEVVQAQAPDPDVAAVLVKLKARRQLAFVVRDQAVADANDYAQQAAVVLDKLRSVAVVLK